MAQMALNVHVYHANLQNPDYSMVALPTVCFSYLASGVAAEGRGL
jgi:hypothetical protein